MRWGKRETIPNAALAVTTTMTPTLRLGWFSLFNAELSPKRYWR